MSAISETSALAPFRVRSFRYQWPADLATSWAFEMEAIILGWYILTETGSVFLLTVFGALQFTGTLVSPLLGVAGDRFGHRNVLCVMRMFYATLASVLLVLAYTDLVTPAAVLAISGLLGLVRPSDLAMRHALVAETMPPGLLMGGMSVSRTTLDSARIAGALSGAGLFAALGMGPAYAVIVGFYLTGVFLTRKVADTRAASVPAASPAVRGSTLRDLREGLQYVWRTPQLLAGMVIAFLANLTAFPLQNGLLPYVAKDIYGADQTGLGYMVAGVAGGALIGSIVLSHRGSAIHPARTMLIACAAWYVLLLAFAHMRHPVAGIPVLAMAGFVQSFSQVPLAAMLLRNSEPAFRGRVMGARMLAIYGLPIGLLVSGPLIAAIGYPWTATLYCTFGLACTFWIGRRWRAHLWPREAPANRW